MQTRIPTRAEALDDHELLTQVWHGSEDALVTLHRRYVNPVYSLTLRILGDPMAAEEVTQDVFIKLWRHPRAYNPNKGRFSSWLLTVARHAAIDELRRNGRRPHTVTTSNGEGQRLAREQTIPKPKAAPETYHLGIILGRLPLDQRKVIELAYFGGMSQ